MSDGAFCHYCQKARCVCTWKRERLPNNPPEEPITFDPDAALASAARVRELSERATAGPWSDEDRRHAALKNIRVVAGQHEIAWVSDVHQRDYQGSFTGSKEARVTADNLDAVGLANAAFIAAARTGWPETAALLVEAVEEVQAARDESREATLTMQDAVQSLVEMRAERDAAVERARELEQSCPLVHAACGACGKNIEADSGLCGCEDNRKHPIADLYRHKLEKRIAELEAEVRRLSKCDLCGTTGGHSPTCAKQWRGEQ